MFVAWFLIARICPITPEVGHPLVQHVERPIATSVAKTICSLVTDGIIAHCILDDPMRGSELANRIGCAGIAGQKKSLATASAKIFLAALTGAAGLRIPVLAPKFLKCLGALSTPIARLIAH